MLRQHKRLVNNTQKNRKKPELLIVCSQLRLENMLQSVMSSNFQKIFIRKLKFFMQIYIMQKGIMLWLTDYFRV